MAFHGSFMPPSHHDRLLLAGTDLQIFCSKIKLRNTGAKQAVPVNGPIHDLRAR